MSQRRLDPRPAGRTSKRFISTDQPLPHPAMDGTDLGTTATRGTGVDALRTPTTTPTTACSWLPSVLENMRITSTVTHSPTSARHRLLHRRNPRKVAMESERIPTTTQASDDGAYNNELVTHDEGTTDVGRQPVLPSPGMVRDPSATLETSIGLLLQELMGDVTSRVITAPRDSPERQGERRTSKEIMIAAMPDIANSSEDVRPSRRLVPVSSRPRTTTQAPSNSTSTPMLSLRI